MQWPGNQEGLPYWRHLYKGGLQWVHPAVSLLRKRPWRGEVSESDCWQKWDSSFYSSTHAKLDSDLVSIHKLGFHSWLQTWGLSWWTPPSLGSISKSLLQGRAARTLEQSIVTDSAGSDTVAASIWSVPAWAMGSAARSMVSRGRSEDDSLFVCFKTHYFLHIFLLFFLFEQRSGTRHMVVTLMVSPVHSHLSTWERPTIPAPQMDAQTDSSGARQRQTMIKIVSTLSVLKRMVRLMDTFKNNFLIWNFQNVISVHLNFSFGVKSVTEHFLVVVQKTWGEKDK